MSEEGLSWRSLLKYELMDPSKIFSEKGADAGTARWHDPSTLAATLEKVSLNLVGRVGSYLTLKPSV